MKNILFEGKSVIKHTCVGTKASLLGWKSGSFVNFCHFPCSWIFTDPDPGEIQTNVDPGPDSQHCLKKLLHVASEHKMHNELALFFYKYHTVPPF
jgi:hypothetical protein